MAAWPDARTAILSDASRKPDKRKMESWGVCRIHLIVMQLMVLFRLDHFSLVEKLWQGGTLDNEMCSGSLVCRRNRLCTAAP